MYLHDAITLCQDQIRALIVSQQMACFCPLPAARIAAKRSEFLDMEFCTDLLFYFGVWVSSYFKNSSWTVWFDICSNLAFRLTLIHLVKFQLTLRNTSSNLFRKHKNEFVR